MFTTRQTTAYLKGLAILLVLITHYTYSYANDIYSTFIPDYAGFVVAIFFVLSGFGIFYSMGKLEEQYGKPLSLKATGIFFWQRALRIYPLFWVSLFSASFLLGTGWEDLHQLSVHTIATYLAFPTVRHEGYTWFIPELVQCYLAGPFLYYFLRKLGMWRYVGLVFGLGVAFMVISHYYMNLLDMINGFGVPDPDSLFYRSVFLSNILLFAGGMVMPQLSKHIKKHVNGYVTLAFVGAFVVSLWLVSEQRFTYREISSEYFLFPLYLISISGLCLSAVSVNTKLPFYRPIGFLGGYTLTLYLFHWQFYTVLENLGLINRDSELTSALFAIALSPVFLLVCVGLQKAALWIRQALSRPAPPAKRVETPVFMPEN